MGEAIGVFDSGVGGLTVVRAVMSVLPNERVIYLGDTARVPYGSKSPRTVERYAQACLGFLLERGVKLALVACNTVSANALPILVQNSPVTVLGAVGPGAETAAAATSNGRIGVIGTLATANSGAYEHAIRAALADAVVTTMACPLLVPLAEEGWITGEVAEAIARRYLSELFERDPDIDTLVLGCTHYPLLEDVLRTVAGQITGRAVTIVDSASAMAHAAATALSVEATLSSSGGTLEIYATDTTRLGDLAPRFLGARVDHFELVDL